MAANGLAMPVFCWHMTALVAFVGLYERAGFALADEPTAAWWLTRPLWVVGPAALLAGLLVLVRAAPSAPRPPRRPARDSVACHRCRAGTASWRWSA